MLALLSSTTDVTRGLAESTQSICGASLILSTASSTLVNNNSIQEIVDKGEMMSACSHVSHVSVSSREISLSPSVLLTTA